jgi:hypothetical protein
MRRGVHLVVLVAVVLLVSSFGTAVATQPMPPQVHATPIASDPTTAVLDVRLEAGAGPVVEVPAPI